ncbi:dynein beta chain, flagellar outer arm-like isoform X2 [Orbicella faveolata]|uniref:dynein beta chain, flagellar outer arm-like isoform X2 n=1 Tax=Orbicella faveolata TaxID=48498 RepID=UPI0009E3B457|nr:dynein beta chain, flagellar outer arm-like isoform X2 [Orbicella faveolata]XP_020627064.1 dynein beta chain, flagellar outer arm-like isoform X2 [Orbicella faveolata]
MELDERLRWIEIRVTSSLKPRAEELKHMFTNEKSREAMFEFCNNEEVKKLFIFSSTTPAGKNLVASLNPPSGLREKSVYFVKIHEAGKLSRDNIITDVAFCDCSYQPLSHASTLTKDVFLPLLSIEMGGGVSGDKLMDLVHRMVSVLQVAEGSSKDQVTLPLPSIEVLSEAAAYSSRRPAVIHVLETAVVNWIKQIKVTLKLDPETEIKKFGPKPGPLDEIEMWSERLEKITSVSEQLCSHVALNIMMNLEDAHSTYAQSFHLVKREIAKAEAETNDNLQFLSTLLPWFEKLHYATKSADMVSVFPPLMHTLFLVWVYSRYYHDNRNFTRLLTMLSNEVVARARQLVGEHVLENLLASYTSLKDALRVCAAFRGCYLDKKDRADETNQQRLSEQSGTNMDSGGIVWHSKLYNDSLTPKTTKIFNHRNSLSESSNGLDTTELWTDSPWPARNNACFTTLNSFMERCNDVLELVQTTQHFEMLTCTAEVGGAGGNSLDSQVKEIHLKFLEAVRSFQQMPHDVLNANETQEFEREFFAFRSVIRDLEHNLADVMRQSFKQCWDTRAKLRLLEVFEGISGRELVQTSLRDTFTALVHGFTQELLDMRTFFESHMDSPPSYPHLPPVANKLLWLRGFKIHIQEPMSRLHRVSPASLKGDDGWRLRDTYSDLIKDIERCEADTIRHWQSTMEPELRARLKQPLLIAEPQSEGTKPALHVNFDPELMLLLREVHYLGGEPFLARLPDPARVLLRSTDDSLLRSTATRLDTIVSRYNSVMTNMKEFEQPLFERKLAKIDELLGQGLHVYTWKTVESADFVEHASYLVCDDLHRNLGVVQSNFREICNVAASWSENGQLDVFSPRDSSKSFSMDKLQEQHRMIHEAHKHTITVGGHRIHALLQSTFEAVQISRASPAWQSYIKYVSGVVMEGLKASTCTSLRSMLNQIVFSNMSQDAEVHPILTIRLELTGSQVLFNPSLDDKSASSSVQESVEGWLNDFLGRGDSVRPLDEDLKSYKQVIADDNEIQTLVKQTKDVVEQNASECKSFLATFREYAFLWMQDVQRTFEEFLAGNIEAHPRKMNRSELIRSRASMTSEKSRKEKERDPRSNRSSAAASTLSTSGAMGLSEKTFLNPKKMTASKEIRDEKGPSLDDFDKEIEIYQTARDEIYNLQDWCDVGWMRVNMRPIKQVLGTYASKWMFVYTKYLSDQVSSTLNDLDSFLKRIEPGIEAITGEEQDIASFMRLMRVFNEVSTQQAEMDSKFIAMKRTIALLEKYDQKLPEMTEKFYTAAPQRWNNLKMKVNQAKQRLGPRIQAEASSVTQELKAFGDRCESLAREFADSEAFNRKCAIYTAFTIMDTFGRRLESMESEAQDLIELQELFEKAVVNFSVLPRLRSDLECLREVWNTWRAVQEQHTEWKRGRWQRINTKLMKKATEAQIDVVTALPLESHEWDVFVGMHHAILDIQACLPIIDDLSRSAMRPRHWKQLVRVTGGAVQISNEGLTRMTLGQLLELGLHNHAEEVRSIIQRAAKDVAIESSLKTYEEVWLSKIFELRTHTRMKGPSSATAPTQDTPGSEFGNDSEMNMHGPRGLSSRVSVTSHGSGGGFSVKDGAGGSLKTRKASVAGSTTFSHSLMNLTQDAGPICLLDKCEPIFEELEDHQVSLQSMLSGSAAGSFADDIMKWQKRLQTIEAVLTVWLDVQEKWIELEDVFSSLDLRIAMPHETNLFSAVNRDFRILMRATEKNPNVLQACSRINIQAKLEKLNMNLQQCWKSLLNHLERRRQKFPRFYFLSTEDVLHVVCNGYDPALVNPYLPKVLENLGALVYEELENEGQIYFNITSVVSSHGEQLMLKQPVPCEGPIDNWLPGLISSLKQTLLDQLTSVLSPAQPERTSTPYGEGGEGAAVPEEPPRTAGSMGRVEKSFTLDNCSEVVLLATQIELCKKIDKSLKQVASGENKEALKEVYDKLTAILEATAMMLKGADKESKAQGGDDGYDSGVNSDDDTEEAAMRRMSRNTSASQGRPGTAAVADAEVTSNISGVSQKPKELPEQEVTEGQGTNKMLLFPSQIQKISNIIAMLSHERNLVQRLIDHREEWEVLKNPIDNFDWQRHARCRWEEEQQACKVDILDMVFDYGFEYQGTASRLVLSPLTDKCYVGLAQAVKNKMVGVCTGEFGTGKTETVAELAKILGNPLYSFNCSTSTNRETLIDIFRGLACSGAWVCLNNISTIPSPVLSVLTQLVTVVLDGLKASKTTVVLQDDEISLAPQGACFGTLDPSGSQHKTAYDPSVGFFPSFKSSASYLPVDLWEMFRPVALVGPDLQVILQVWLLSQGFTQVSSLASKIVTLRGLCLKLLPNSSKSLSGDLSLCLLKCTGWGAHSLKRMIEDAGSHLGTSSVELQVSAPEQRGPSREEKDVPERAESPTDAVAAVNAPLEALRQDEHLAPVDSEDAPDPRDVLKVEEHAVVLALRDTYMPGLDSSDAVMFATLLADLFPNVQVPMIFESYGSQGNKMQMNDQVSNLDEIPVLSKAPGEPSGDNVEVLSDMQSAIKVATGKLGLQPGAAFQARVAQLAELVKAHKLVCITGPSGCGKTECIRTLGAAHREMGHLVKTDIVCTEAVESEELLGYVDPDTREWRDGVLTVLLRRQARQLRVQETESKVTGKPLMKWLHLDGTIDPMQMELFGSIVQNTGTVVLGNNERIKIPDALLIVWELEILENLSPAVLSSVGMLCMNTSDVNWPLLVDRWLAKRPEREVDVLRELCDRYIGPTLEYLASKTSVPPVSGAPPTQNKPSQLRHVVPVTEMGMVNTLLTLVEAIISNYQDLMPPEFENYFCYSAMWAFGGTLVAEHRLCFSQWWREQWNDYVMLPGDEEVWNYYVFPETHEFLSWADSVPPYSQTAAEGIPNEAYVHTIQNERISHLVGLLSDGGKPVLLVGEAGCGKTSILRHRLKQHGGDIGEVLSLTVFCNKFTTSRSLWKEMSSCLEWKHARTFVPKGNKRLTCLVDDLNLSRANRFGAQTAQQLVRQHIDHGGVIDPETHQWREIRDVTYLSAYNPQTPPTTARLNSRLLRHFALFSVTFPSQSELHYIYTQQLEKHFIIHVTQSQHTTSDSSSQEPTEGHSQHQGSGDHDKAMRDILSAISHVTVELQGHLRGMFLPTSQRCHYMFTMSDLTMVFRNLCLTLRPGCAPEDLLLLWKHECDWVYGRRLIDSVDRERFQQAFLTAAKKRFTEDEKLSVVTDPTPFFTNLVDSEDTAGEVMGAGSSEGTEDDVHLLFRHITDMRKVQAVLEHGVEEYNKDFPRLKITLYEDVMETICRLVRVLQCPHECGHALLISQGSPGMSTNLAQLAAHLCGYSVFRINSSALSASDRYTLESFKGDLVSAYTRAGVKGEHLMLLLPESDLTDEDFLVHVSEFLVSSSISHLFTEEEQTSVINAVRTEVTQAGLAYTRDVAWDFFLKTVRENLRVVLTVSSLGPRFQKRCRDFPSLMNTVSIILLPHWSKEALVTHAYHLLKDVEIFSPVQTENLAHLLASMHLAIKQQDSGEEQCGTYGHITNTGFEVFVERFICLVKKRHQVLRREHEQMAAALQTIERGTLLAEQLKTQLGHEKMVLEQKKEGNLQLLLQIGQDKAIAEEQVRLVKRQQERIQKLKKALPEYQIAHERAVFKAAAVVTETKRVLKILDGQGLAELRALQKPDNEIEDLLAAIIIIVKSPSSDLTWNKGAKRLMANLDRFREELGVFDEMQLTESTLEVVEPYLKKPHFNGDYLEKKTNNPAVGSLLLWVRGVVRYHRMMQSKVKPLHSKVSETSSAVELAVGKLSSMESKLKDLEERLRSLAQAYEDASIDKCRQYELTETLDSQLSQAAYFEQVLSSGRQKWLQLLESISTREEAVAGGVAMAAAFATYLGPYSFSFRREMLTVHWPKCLDERGVMLVVDSSAPYAGAEVFMMEKAQQAPTSSAQPAVSEQEVPGGQLDENVNEDESREQDEPNAEETDEKETEGEQERPHSAELEKQDVEHSEKEEQPSPQKQEDGSDDYMFSVGKDQLLSRAKLTEYDSFALAVLKLLLGEYHVRRLLTKGVGPRKIENAILAKSSWQRVPLLVDPYNKGLELIRTVEDGENLLEIDLAESDPSSILKIEKAVTSGTALVLYNIDRDVDSLFMPLIYHVTTSTCEETEQDSQLVKFGSRRVMCHPEFRLYLISRSSRPAFSTEVSSITTLVNLRLDEEALAEEIEIEAFHRVQPELYVESRKSLMVMMELLRLLENIDSKLIGLVTARQGTDIWEETEVIAELVKCRSEVAHRLTHTLNNFNRLKSLRELFQPLAKRAVMMFSLLSSLSRVQHEYRFSLGYFLSLFRSAVGRDVEPFKDKLEYESDSEDTEGIKKESRTTVQIKAVDVEGAPPPAVVQGDEGRNPSHKKLPSKRMSVILPAEVQLPSPGVEYTPYSPEQTDQLIDSLSQSFYRHVSRSIDQHHRLLFSSLLTLYKVEKRAEDGLVQEEISLLLSGKLSSPVPALSDFDPTLLQPSWIAQESWELIMAVSSLKGPLDSVCTHIASNPGPWRDWYESERPEAQPLPIESEDAEDSPTLTALDRLLMIRCLRSDRFERAMLIFVENEVGDLVEKSLPRFDELLSGIKHSIPIFVVMPDHTSMNTPFKISPVESIRRIAEAHNVQCQQISVGHGQEEIIDVALATAVRTDTWLVIENLQLASRHWLEQLYNRLSRLHLQAETSSTPSQWRVFLLCEPADHLPVGLLLFSHQLAWDVVQREGPEYQPLNSKDLDLKTIITSTLEAVPRLYWEQAREQSLAVRSTLFGLCVNHSVLLMRHQLGTRASSGRYPLSTRDLLTSFEMVIKWASKQEGLGASQLKALSDVIAEGVYGGKVSDPWDRRYVAILTHQVIKETALQQHSSLALGSISLPVPPANVDPTEYSKWFNEKTGTEDAVMSTVKALGLDISVEREYNEARTSEFIHKLNKLHRDINHTTALAQEPSAGAVVNMPRLRASMDLCLERLPTLLKIEGDGAMPVTQLLPRVLSQLRALSVYSESGSTVGSDERLSESMGYVLQKECQWFNCLLYHIRHSLQILEQCVLGGSPAIPTSLVPVVDALQEEVVPSDWLHPDCQPSPHSLASWLIDLSRRHKQLSDWVRRGIVPNPNSEPLVGRGQLTSVWLGGLANPGALMTSLRHEKAAMAGCTVDEVELRCSLAKSYLSRDESSDDLEQGLVVSGLFIEGASLDLDQECLVEPM